MADKNFLTEIIDADLAEGKIREIHTRFPPEPNGYLHIGSAKAIYINWSIANQYGGKFNLRFDDTNPTKEKTEFVESIMDDVKWLGADFEDRLFFASNYFDRVPTPTAASSTAATTSTSATSTPRSSSSRARHTSMT